MSVGVGLGSMKGKKSTQEVMIYTLQSQGKCGDVQDMPASKHLNRVENIEGQMYNKHWQSLETMLNGTVLASTGLSLYQCQDSSTSRSIWTES